MTNTSLSFPRIYYFIQYDSVARNISNSGTTHNGKRISDNETFSLVKESGPMLSFSTVFLVFVVISVLLCHCVKK